MEVQFSLTYHVQAMVKSERNRQIMCEGGLVSKLLVHHRSILLAPNHPLHLPITRILEKLSSQAITHSDFRSEIVDLCGPDTCISCCAGMPAFKIFSHGLCKQDAISDVLCFFPPQKVPVFRRSPYVPGRQNSNAITASRCIKRYIYLFCDND